MLTRATVKVLRSLTSLLCNLSRAAILAARVQRARNTRYARYVAKVTPARRLICFIICFCLIVSSQLVGPRSMGKSADKGAGRLTQGPPGLDLPNLDDARQMNPGAPKIAPPASAALASNIAPPTKAMSSLLDGNWPMALIDQRNRVGTSGEDLLSRNFNWGTPIVNLPGRAGMDLNLGLSLNSLVWTKSGSNILFNLDEGFPSPGFRLGLPELGAAFHNTETGTASMLVTMPSGQRHEFRQNPALGSNVYEEMGSTYMLLVVRPGIINYLDTTWTLLLTDGTAYKFKIIANNPKCIEIKDRNGNYISISYTSFERIGAVTDTMGRVVNFNYDGSNRLISITQNWGGGAHTYATFAYDNVTIQTNFPGLDLIGAADGRTISALSRVDMADGKVYAFEYNTYAQVKTIKCYAPNTADLGDFPDDYTLLSSITYDLPADANSPQSDCPRFSTRLDWAKDWNSGALTSYDGDGSTWGSMTSPDETVYKEFFGASGWQRGLTLKTENWSNGVRKKWTASTWVNENPNVSYWLNPRVVETNVYDENGNRRRTTIAYADFGAVSDVREYAAPPNTSTVLRHTHFDYLRGTAYTGNLNRRLTQLVKSQSIYDGNGALHSKLTFEYDLGGECLVHQGPPVRHDTTNFGPGFVQGRGNLNSVRRWDVTAADKSDKSVASTIGYNTSGSMIFSRDPLNHETKFSYADSFSDSVNTRNTFAYPTTTTNADNHSSTVQYNYDFGAVTRIQDPKGAVVVNTYDSIGRVERVTNEVNGAYTRYVYAPDHLSVQSFKTVNDLNSEFYQITVFDGNGRMRGVASEHPGSAGGYKAQYKEYDIMGRLAWQTNPAEIDVNWETAGDDEPGWAWSQQQYDWMGRFTIEHNQDGGIRTTSYDGCGCAGGQKVISIDEMGRRKEQNYDTLGRMWRERTYNWGGSDETGIYTTTTYTYNARDQITNINMLDNASGASQNTVMTYDGHERLKTRQLPKYLGNPQSATPYDSYEYYPNDTLKRETDPRGATASYEYNKRGLVTSVTYGAPSGVAAAPNVAFAYDEVGNRIEMDDGPGVVTYTYDGLNRLTSETRVFDRLSRYTYETTGQPHQNTFTIGYNYNLTGQLTQIQTPTGDTIDYTNDKTGMATKVSGTPRDGVTDYITDIKYRAWGAAKQVSYGYSDYTITTQYNNRMLVSSMNDQTRLGATFGYNLDGRLSAVQGLNDYARTLDRSLSYDHIGRVTETRSGSAAGLGSSEPEQLKQFYVYDAFNHMASRSGKYWYISEFEESAFTATYTNDRGTDVVDNGDAQNWQHDAAGNIKSYQNTYVESIDRNAVRQMARKSYFYPSGEGPLGVEEYGYDGDGNLILLNSTWNGRKEEYYVRSTVLSENLLNGRIDWALVDGQYRVRRSLPSGSEPARDLTERKLAIHVGGEEIAVRNYETIEYGQRNRVIWQHRDPYNTIAKSDGNAFEGSLYSVDPLGVLVKTASQDEFDGYWNPPSGGDPSPPSGFYSDSSGQSSSYGYSSPIAGNWGLNCYLDGIQVPCEKAFRYVSNGSANVDKINTPTGGVNVPGLSITENFSQTSNTTGGWNTKTGQFEYTTKVTGTSSYTVHTSGLFSSLLSAPLDAVRQTGAELSESNTQEEPDKPEMTPGQKRHCNRIAETINNILNGYHEGSTWVKGIWERIEQQASAPNFPDHTSPKYHGPGSEEWDGHRRQLEGKGGKDKGRRGKLIEQLKNWKKSNCGPPPPGANEALEQSRDNELVKEWHRRQGATQQNRMRDPIPVPIPLPPRLPWWKDSLLPRVPIIILFPTMMKCMINPYACQAPPQG